MYHYYIKHQLLILRNYVACNQIISSLKAIALKSRTVKSNALNMVFSKGTKHY